jgi:hypothetical protein
MSIIDINDSEQSEEQKEGYLFYDGMVVQPFFPSEGNWFLFQILCDLVLLFLHKKTNWFGFSFLD